MEIADDFLGPRRERAWHAGENHVFRPPPKLCDDVGSAETAIGQFQPIQNRRRPLFPIDYLAVNVGLELLDRVLLLLDHGLHQIADRHHTDEAAVVDHRKVPHALLGDDLHAFLHGAVE